MSGEIDEQWHECSRSQPPEQTHLVTGQRRPDGSWAITGFHPPGSLKHLHAPGVFWAKLPEWILAGPGPQRGR